jgi:hypothetical protein
MNNPNTPPVYINNYTPMPIFYNDTISQLESNKLKNKLNDIKNKDYTCPKKSDYETGKKVMRNFLNISSKRILDQLLKSDEKTTDLILKKFNAIMVYNLNTNKMKSYISKTLKELYELDNNPSNIKIINELAKDNIEFQNYINKKFEVAYLEYLESSEYDLDMSKLEIKKGKRYMKEYSEHVRNFLNYYRNKIPYKIASDN